MMSLLIQLFINNKEDVSNPSVKKAYAALSSITGILLNLFLCMAKIAIGLLCHSVAISTDGFNNLSDAGTSLASLLGFKAAGYGKGSTHPFGHGRIEW
ncbi:MAG: cation transporter, partial [Lachnospiraceae bacterium]|nr:cation transporter [Lachnospiraceae bacterium]